MDFDGGSNVTLECPNKKHRKKSRANYYIDLECDTWPKCKVCKKPLKQARQ